MACDLKAADKEKVLGVLDTYHDFCKGERTTKSARDSNSEDDEGDPKRIEVMRQYLPKLLRNLYGAPVGTTYQENIKNITCNKVTSVSSIEHSGVDLFEENPVFRDVLNANPETREILSFQEIIDAYKTPPTKEALINKYKNGLHYRILELSKSGRRFGKDPSRAATETKEIEILSDFILNFFFFTETPDDGVYMSFDAGERIVGDIFRDRKYVKCCIFPETLADSATTSLGMLAGRTEFVYPSTERMIQFTSNLFSQENYKIYFEDKGYTDQNPYGFTLNIQHKTKNGIKLVLPFSPKQTEGPSVNYLIDILEMAEKNAGKVAGRTEYSSIQKKGTMLNLGEALDKNKAFRDEFEKEVKEHKNGVVPDLKRGGDHEAVNASKAARNLKYKNFVFCTIDILCALKSRLEMLNTIWQGKDKIILYRYPDPGALPADVMKYKYAEKAKALYDILCKLYTFYKADLPRNLTSQISNFTKGKLALVDYSDREKATPPIKGTCEEALNVLLRLVMLDLEEYTTSLAPAPGKNSPSFLELDEAQKTKMYDLAGKYVVFYGKDKDASKALVTIVKEAGKDVAKYGENNIQDDFNTVLTFYNKVVENIRNNLNLDITSSKETEVTDNGKKFREKVYQIQKQVTEDKGGHTLFLLQEHPVFAYNPAVFEKLYDALIFLYDLTEKNKVRPSRDYNKILNKILSGDPTAPYDYFALVKDVVAQFHIKEYRDSVQSIFDFRSDAKFGGAGMTKEETEQARRDMLVGKEAAPTANKVDRDNGVVVNILNYYKELKTAGKFPRDIGVVPYKAPLAAAAPAPAPAAAVVPVPVPAPAPAPAPARAQRRRKGGSQMGGGNVYQYYNLSDLLFKVSSIAASFVESVYSSEFPTYVVYMKLQEKLAERIDQDTKLKDFVELTKEFKRVYSANKDVILPFIGGYKITDRSFDSEITGIAQKQVEYASKTTSGEKKTVFDEIVKQINTLFSKGLKTEAIAGKLSVVFPSIMDVLKQMVSPKYIVQDEDDINMYASELLYKEINSLWQAGLFEIRQNKEYLYEYSSDKRGISTEDLISYILSLELTDEDYRAVKEGEVAPRGVVLRGEADEPLVELENNAIEEEAEAEANVEDEEEEENLEQPIKVQTTLGENITFFDSTAGVERTTPTAKIYKGISSITTIVESTVANKMTIDAVLLLIFTLIENVMNPTKKSFFLVRNQYVNSFFSAKKEWDTKLYLLIKQLFNLMGVSLDPAKPKMKLLLKHNDYQMGGMFKKTRKSKRPSPTRKSRKYRKTMRAKR